METEDFLARQYNVPYFKYGNSLNLSPEAFELLRLLHLSVILNCSLQFSELKEDYNRYHF
jgi:hypothetical protein